MNKQIFQLGNETIGASDSMPFCRASDSATFGCTVTQLATPLIPLVLNPGNPIGGSPNSQLLATDAGGNLVALAGLTVNTGGILLYLQPSGFNNAVQIVNGSQIAILGNASVPTAGFFTDGSNNVQLADTVNAVSATSGNVSALGTSGNTYKWGAGSTAPGVTTIAGGFLNAYGASPQDIALTNPDAWLLVDIGGTRYKVPCYL